MAEITDHKSVMETESAEENVH